MKKTVKFLPLLLSAAALVGCSEDLSSDLAVNVDQGVTLTATIANTDTKISFDDEGSSIDLSWESTDSFSIFDASGDYVCDFTCDDAENGKFSADLAAGGSEITSGATYTAVYPATEAETLAEREALSETYTQTQNESAAHLSDVIMMSDEFKYGSENVTFAHEVAIMKMTYTSDEVPTSIEVANGDDTYTLALNVDSANSYTSYIAMKPCGAVERVVSITLTTASGSESYATITDKAYVAGNFYNAPVTELSLVPASISISETAAPTGLDGDYVEDMTATLSYNGDADVVWTSSDELVATVEDGEVTFCGTGEVTITCASIYDSSVCDTETYDVKGIAYVDGVAQINCDDALQAFISSWNSDQGSSMPSDDMLLTADITASSSFTYRLGGGGSTDSAFGGTIDGGNHTISGIQTPTGTTYRYEGFVGYSAAGLIIKNLTIANSAFVGGEQTGAFVGQACADHMIYNCHLKNTTVTANAKRVGGIMGYGAFSEYYGDGSNPISASIIMGCTVDEDCVITGLYEVGGICGLATCAVIGCSNAGEITATSCENTTYTGAHVGGIVGKSSKRSVVGCCYNTGDISATYSLTGNETNIYTYIGGIAGNHSNSTAPYIDGCYSTGTLTYPEGSIQVGAIAGSTYNDPASVVWLAQTGIEYGYVKSNGTGNIATCASTEADLHTQTNVTAMNNATDSTIYTYFTEGGNWHWLQSYDGAYYFALVDGKIAIEESAGVAAAVDAAANLDPNNTNS